MAVLSVVRSVGADGTITVASLVVTLLLYYTAYTVLKQYCTVSYVHAFHSSMDSLGGEGGWEGQLTTASITVVLIRTTDSSCCAAPQ